MYFNVGPWKPQRLRSGSKSEVLFWPGVNRRAAERSTVLSDMDTMKARVERLGRTRKQWFEIVLSLQTQRSTGQVLREICFRRMWTRKDTLEWERPRSSGDRHGPGQQPPPTPPAPRLIWFHGQRRENVDDKSELFRSQVNKQRYKKWKQQNKKN